MFKRKIFYVFILLFVLGFAFLCTTNFVHADTSITITFDANRGKFSDNSTTISKSITSGQNFNAIGTVENPTRTDCEFEGWYTIYGEKVTSSTTFNENTTLYAHWSCDDYITITLNANKGFFSNGFTTVTVKWTADGAIDNNFPVPIRDEDDCEFEGWYTTANGGNKVTSLNGLADATTLYAHWSCDVYDDQITIKLDANGGNVANSNFTAFVGQAIGTLPTPTYPDDDCEFDGWYTIYGEKATSSTTFNENTTLYAHWSCDDYITITLNANKGFFSNGFTTVSVKWIADGAIDNKFPIPIRDEDNCEFEGWYTTANGGNKITSLNGLADATTLYAHWSCDVYEESDNQIIIKLDANGGTVSSDTLYTSIGSSITLPVPSRNGYIFDGWYTAKVGGTKITGGTSISNNVTLYAHWVKESDLYGGKTSEDPGSNIKTGDSHIYFVAILLMISLGYLIYFFKNRYQNI